MDVVVDVVVDGEGDGEDRVVMVTAMDVLGVPE